MSIFTAVSESQSLISAIQVTPYLDSGGGIGGNSTSAPIPNPCYTLQQDTIALLDTLTTSFISLVQNTATMLLSPLNCVANAVSGLEGDANNALGTDVSANPMQSLTNTIMGGIGDLYHANNSMIQNIQNMANNLTENNICNMLNEIQGAINSVLNDIKNALSALLNISGLMNDITNAISNIMSAINCIKSAASPNFLDALKDQHITSPATAVFTQVSEMKNQLTDPGTMVQQGLQSIGQNLSVANNLQAASEPFKALSL